MKKHCQLCLAAAFLLSIPLAKGQYIGNSIYSRFGAGDDELRNTAPLFSMGDAATAFRSPLILNTINPASLSNLSATTFYAGILGRFTSTGFNNQSTSDKRASFNALRIAFPFAKGWGGGMGISPSYSAGVKSIDTLASDIHQIEQSITLSGNLNRVYMNQGIDPIRWFTDSSKHSLSIGIQAAFDFGNYYFANINYFLGSDTSRILGTDIRREFNVQHWMLRYGVQYEFPVNKKWSACIAGTYDQNLSGQFNLTQLDRRFIARGTFREIVDTTNLNTDIRGNVILPASWTAGFCITGNKRLTISGSVTYTDYKKFSWPLEQPLLGKTRTYAAGAQYYPASASGSGFLKHSYYRAGLRFRQYPFTVAGKSLQETALNLGMGLPIKKAASTINIGIELSQRGNATLQQVEEKQILLHVGFLLNDVWFRRSKID